MLNYVQIEKLRDKVFLAIICWIIFGFLYTTVNKGDLPFDSSDIGKSMTYSLEMQLFRADIFNSYNKAFVFVIIQSILTYIILIL